eukprot:881691-Pelagomonas_calceolata.AAC.6
MPCSCLVPNRVYAIFDTRRRWRARGGSASLARMSWQGQAMRRGSDNKGRCLGGRGSARNELCREKFTAGIASPPHVRKFPERVNWPGKRLKLCVWPTTASFHSILSAIGWSGIEVWWLKVEFTPRLIWHVLRNSLLNSSAIKIQGTQA